MTRLRDILGLASVCFAHSLTACAPGEQTLELFAYGESFIEHGIPASEMADHWQVTFEHFEVSLAEVKVGDSEFPGDFQLDLTTPTDGKGQRLAEIEAVPEGGFGYSIRSMRVQGKAATQGPELQEVRFDWLFDTVVGYEDCEYEPSDEDAESSRFEVTIHADHLFSDSLVSTSPVLRFAPLAAADANADGIVTLEELAAVGIGDYDPGNAAIANLAEWMRAQARSVGHANGEGHCTVVPASDR